MPMIRDLLNRILGCRHRHMTLPLTIGPRSTAEGGPAAQTYVVCLDCGEQIAYDWEAMRHGPAARSAHSMMRWWRPRHSRTQI
jgi:hypothetical protein